MNYPNELLGQLKTMVHQVEFATEAQASLTGMRLGGETIMQTFYRVLALARELICPECHGSGRRLVIGGSCPVCNGTCKRKIVGDPP